MDQALNSQKTPHTSPLRANYGMSFVSILMKNDRVIKGFYCNWIAHHNLNPFPTHWSGSHWPQVIIGLGDILVLPVAPFTNMV